MATQTSTSAPNPPSYQQSEAHEAARRSMQTSATEADRLIIVDMNLEEVDPDPHRARQLNEMMSKFSDKKVRIPLPNLLRRFNG